MKNILKIEIYFLFLIISLTTLYLIIKNEFWNFFIVPVGTFTEFHDLYCVINWSRLGGEFSNLEFIYNDSNGCRLNYPRIWILLSSYFLSKLNFYYLIIINFVIYNFIFYYFIKKYKSYFFIYFYLSGCSMLLLERGNAEIFILFIVFLFFISKNWIKILFLISSTLLKIFPIFMAIALLTRKNLNLLFFAIILGIIYFLFSFEELNYVFLKTLQTGDLSYGTQAMTINIKNHLGFEINYFILNFILIIFSLFFYKIFFFKMMINYKYYQEEMFLGGGGIFVSTFLLGSNHDYRLIFLLFCIPLILNLKNKLLKYFVLVSLTISSELHRLIYLFGFFGGVINTLFKIILFILLFLILLDIIAKNFYKIQLYLKKN